MEGTFDAKEPLPRLCSVDIPVLFDSTTSNNSSDIASAAAQIKGETVAPQIPNTGAGADEHGPGVEEDEDDAVCKELDACMRVLEGLKPKVRRIAEGGGRENATARNESVKAKTY